MRTWIGLCLLAAACGGPAKPAPTPDPAPPVADPEPAGDHAAQVCVKILALHRDGCPFLADYDQDEAGCQNDVRSAGEDPLALAIGNCFIQSAGCDATTQCIDGAIQAASQPGDGGGGGGSSLGFRECGASDQFGAVGYPRAEWEQRHGAAAKTFADAPSSKDRPIEVCETQGQIEWLLATRCADGSSPFTNGSQAHDARVGNVGQGGRCKAIIDHYEVKCPEQTYQVYIDMYVCPLP